MVGFNHLSSVEYDAGDSCRDFLSHRQANFATLMLLDKRNTLQTFQDGLGVPKYPYTDAIHHA